MGEPVGAERGGGGVERSARVFPKQRQSVVVRVRGDGRVTRRACGGAECELPCGGSFLGGVAVWSDRSSASAGCPATSFDGNPSTGLAAYLSARYGSSRSCEGGGGWRVVEGG